MMPMLMSVASHDKKFMLHLLFICFGLRIAVVLFMMLFASCDSDVSVYGIQLPKSHVTPHFDFPNLRPTVVSFTIPLTS